MLKKIVLLNFILKVLEKKYFDVLYIFYNITQIKHFLQVSIGKTC